MFGFKEKISKREIAQIENQAIFKGRIHPIDTIEKAENALKFLMSEKIVGFDSEWKPTFGKGGRYSKSALIQISTHTDAYLFHTNKIGMPAKLAEFLASPNIKKIGLSLKDDYQSIKLLTGDFPFGGFLDLQDIVPTFGIKDKGLRQIYAIIFNEKISKAQQKSNWTAATLSLAQLKYAALDAYACLRIYQELMRIRKESTMKPILYFANWCSDTSSFISALERLEIEYIPFDITQNGAMMKAFLKLRDNHPAFDKAKQSGEIGIPALLFADEKVILNLADLGKILT